MASVGPSLKNITTASVVKYLDIDSTYRNRNNYPNPNDFVIPMTYPGRKSTAETAVDPIVDAIPYTGSSKTTANTTRAGSTNSLIFLDALESPIENFYINSILEIGGIYTTIISYSATDKTATVNPAFTVAPVAGTVYLTRVAAPIFVGVVSGTSGVNFFSFNNGSLMNDVYKNSYVRFTSGVNTNLVYLIQTYVGSTQTLYTSLQFANIPQIGDTFELDAYSRDNASTLAYSGTVTSTLQNSLYEIELLWLSVPNINLGVGYGGTLDKYPYVYVQLYNEGKISYSQPLFSNNPNSSRALFKVPISDYGTTAFLTLTDSLSRQIIRFETNQDIRFTITLPNGTILSYAANDNLSPLAPNPLSQVGAVFSLKKVAS